MKRERRHSPVFLLAVGLAVACGQSVEQRRATVHELQADPSPADPSGDDLQRIRTMTDDPDRDVRAAALGALVRRGAPDAAGVVVEHLADPDGFVRAAAIALVGEQKDALPADRLARLLAEDPEPLVRLRAAEALGVLGGESALGGLIRGLEDSTEKVRLASVEGVRKLGPAAATPVLIRVLLEDDQWEVRAGAAQALGESGEADVAAALEAALGDENEYVRAAAGRALRAHAAIRARQPLAPEGEAAPPAGS